MSPSSSATTRAAGRPSSTETTRFRCGCGRSVAAQRGSQAATTGRCSTCRTRHRSEEPLHRGS